MAYADPPYPGLSSKYYRDEPTFSGEVDHKRLIESLRSSYDGWALSTSSKALRYVLPMCPAAARVCAWVKPIGACPRTFGIHGTWEPVIVVPGRALRPGVRDWLSAQPARFGGDLPGRKSLAFCAWLFDLMGLVPGDTLDDLFPGTGIVSRAWREASARAPSDAFPRGLSDELGAAAGDESQAAVGYASSGDGDGPGPSDMSRGYRDDVSPGAVADVSTKYSDDLSPRAARAGGCR